MTFGPLTCQCVDKTRPVERFASFGPSAPRAPCYLPPFVACLTIQCNPHAKSRNGLPMRFLTITRLDKVTRLVTLCHSRSYCDTICHLLPGIFGNSLSLRGM